MLVLFTAMETQLHQIRLGVEAIKRLELYGPGLPPPPRFDEGVNFFVVG